MVAGADIGGMSYAFGTFLVDVISSEAGQINWVKLLSAIILLPLDVLTGMTGAAVTKILQIFGVAEEKLEEFQSGTSQGFLHLFDEFSAKLGNLSNYPHDQGFGSRSASTVETFFSFLNAEVVFVTIDTTIQSMKIQLKKGRGIRYGLEKGADPADRR